MFNNVLAAFKILFALLLLSASAHALISNAKKISFSMLFDPIRSVSSLLSYLPTSFVWIVLLVSVGVIIFNLNTIIKR